MKIQSDREEHHVSEAGGDVVGADAIVVAGVVSGVADVVAVDVESAEEAASSVAIGTAMSVELVLGDVGAGVGNGEEGEGMSVGRSVCEGGEAEAEGVVDVAVGVSSCVVEAAEGREGADDEEEDSGGAVSVVAGVGVSD